MADEMVMLDSGDTASDMDRRWFERHPTRNYRVRGFVPGEVPVSMPCGPGFWWVVVVRSEAGNTDVRARITVRLDRMPPDDDATLARIVNVSRPKAWSPVS